MISATLYQRLSPLLRPFSGPYALLMQRRRQAYALGEKESYRTKAPCVSVGNIAWGGTGKTPLTSCLLDWAAERDIRAVVLSRGYGGKPGEHPLAVTPDTPPQHCGDEPLMLARAHPKARVVVFPKRAEAARFAENNFEPELFLLDDGMQHLAVARDVDLVLLRPVDLLEEWGKVIPAGSWREGPTALAAASAFLLKASAAEVERLQPLAQKRLATFGVPLFTFDVQAVGLRTLHAGQSLTTTAEASIAGDYVLTAGVGNPAGVKASAHALLQRPPSADFFFDDHHAFTTADVRRLYEPGLPVICTEKDAVKLTGLVAGASVPFFSLTTRLVWGPSLFSGQSFFQWWEERLRALKPNFFL